MDIVGPDNNIKDCLRIFEQRASKVLSTVFELLEKEGSDKRGGYFCIANAKGVPLFVSLIGSVPQEKAEKYFRYAVKKARRLGKHPKHVSSWQSRNPERGQWGGAVRAHTDFIISFSGLPESWDEAAMLLTVIDTYSAPGPSLALAVRIKGNEQFQKLFAHVMAK